MVLSTLMASIPAFLALLRLPLRSRLSSCAGPLALRIGLAVFSRQRRLPAPSAGCGDLNPWKMALPESVFSVLLLSRSRPVRHRSTLQLVRLQLHEPAQYLLTCRTTGPAL